MRRQQPRRVHSLSSGFSLVGRDWGDPPMSSLCPLITAVSPHKILKSPSPIFVGHDKNFFRYFFNLCMTKANLTSITSLRMQTLLSYLMLHHCMNLKVIRYKSTSFNRIVADKLHHVIAAQQ